MKKKGRLAVIMNKQTYNSFMENLFDQAWGKLALDRQNKRLHMTLYDSTEAQAQELHEAVVEAVEQHQVQSILCDIKQRRSSTETNVQNSIENFKKAMQHGLERIAILRSPANEKEQQLTDQFIAGMSNEQVKYFDNRIQAMNWLNKAGKSRRSAA